MQSQGEIQPQNADEVGLLKLDALSAEMRAKLAIGVVESCLHKLSGRLVEGAGIDPTRVIPLREALERDGKCAQLKAEMERLHADSLFALVAADSKLGRAYALGHELSDICLTPNSEITFNAAFGAQVVTVKDRLADLASSFPPHASRAVVFSLRAWEVWAAEPKLEKEDLDWRKDGVGVTVALARQGERWRDLLAGDKLGQDMLDTRHYIQAAKSMVRTMVKTALHFVAPLLPLLVLPVVALLGGIAIIVLGDSNALGALFTVLGAIGITGAGVRARLGSIATRLQTQLWGASLDLAIGEAALVGPAEWGMTVTSVPASGAAPKASANLETLHKFRAAIASGSAPKIAELLSPHAEFISNGDVMKRPEDDVAGWLCQLPTINRIASLPKKVESPWPSVLITCHDRPTKIFEVWWIQENKVRYWQELTRSDEAMNVAFEQSRGPSPTD